MKTKEDILKEEIIFLENCINNTNSVRRKLKDRIINLKKEILKWTQTRFWQNIIVKEVH